MSDNRLLTPDAVAEELGIPRNTLYQWRHFGTGPLGIRVGRHLRYRREDLDHWLQAQTSQTGNRSVIATGQKGRNSRRR